jgi:hypothetical protein
MHTHRVQIFDSEGNYKREFGSEGKETDGQLYRPNGTTHHLRRPRQPLLVLDDTNRLQVFSPECKHLCTRSDLGISGGMKGIAWGTRGGLVVANGSQRSCRLWGGTQWGTGL